MWDERYSENDYAYGTQPNDFLVSVAETLPRGKVLCLAGGEGRNAVWLAQRGFDVTVVDASRVGLDKALRLAGTRGVTIDVVTADLADYVIEPSAWDLIVSIFCHLPPSLRREVHRKVVAGLKPGGVFVLEGFTLAQLSLGTGGPSNPELMMDLETLKAELTGLRLSHAREMERHYEEGPFHRGVSAVVQILGTTPGA